MRVSNPSRRTDLRLEARSSTRSVRVLPIIMRSGWKLGEIPEASSTYNVIGNGNCQGLVIGETTLGGLSELSNVGKDHRNGTIIDYGQLIYITLQRAATAREAISVMHELTSKYGYASDMEGFSISDASTGEVWYMEFIGKGGFEKGALWVALRVPEGSVMAHANQARSPPISTIPPSIPLRRAVPPRAGQARITTFLPCDDADTCRMAPDVVSFAIKRGYWKGAPDECARPEARSPRDQQKIDMSGSSAAAHAVCPRHQRGRRAASHQGPHA